MHSTHYKIHTTRYKIHTTPYTHMADIDLERTFRLLQIGLKPDKLFRRYAHDEGKRKMTEEAFDYILPRVSVKYDNERRYTPERWKKMISAWKNRSLIFNGTTLNHIACYLRDTNDIPGTKNLLEYIEAAFNCSPFQQRGRKRYLDDFWRVLVDVRLNIKDLDADCADPRYATSDDVGLVYVLICNSDVTDHSLAAKLFLSYCCEYAKCFMKLAGYYVNYGGWQYSRYSKLIIAILDEIYSCGTRGDNSITALTNVKCRVSLYDFLHNLREEIELKFACWFTPQYEGHCVAQCDRTTQIIEHIDKKITNLNRRSMLCVMCIWKFRESAIGILPRDIMRYIGMLVI